MRYPNVGSTVLDHVAFRVRKGKMKEAVAFFRYCLGWELTDHRVTWPGGKATFVIPSHVFGIPIQLTENAGHTERCVTYDATHLALRVLSPRATAKKIDDWALRNGYNCQIKPGNKRGTKWFVRLNSLFTFEFKFVRFGSS